MTSSRATSWFVAACALVLCGCPGGGGGGGGTPDGGEPDAGQPTASLSLSDAPSYDFGTRPAGVTVEHTFTLSNSGDGSASALAPASALTAPFSFKGGSYPGTGGTCGATLAAHATCTLLVTFAPTQAGSASDLLAIAYNDGATSKIASVGLKGAGVAPALLGLSDGPSYDYGTTATGTALDHTFTVTNSGGFAASAVAPGSGLSGPFNFKGGAYPGTGGTCASTLAPGASCTVVVTFAPVSPGPATARLAIAYNDGAANQTAAVDLKGDSNTPADVTISDGAVYDYGSKAVGSSTNHTFTVTNSGGLPATGLVASGISAPFSFLGGSYPGTGGTCGASLAASASCTLVITFAPTAAVTSTATLALAFDTGGSSGTVTRDLRGTGITPAALSLSDAPSYDYGTHASGTVTPHTFTLTNSGGVTATGLTDAVTLSAPFSFPGGYPGTGGTCQSTLAANASCTVVVTFAPTATGSFSSTVGVLYFDGAATRVASRPVTGRGTTQAFLVLSDQPTYDFGVQPTFSATDHAFTVTNAGAQSASAMAGGALGAPFSFKGGGYPGSGGTCGASLAVGASCTVVVTFAPTNSGTVSDVLSVTYNDGTAAQSASVGLRGTGTNVASLMISDTPSWDFGTHPVGSATDHAFSVINVGAGAASAIAAAALGAPFSFKGGAYPGTGGSCGTTLAPGASCLVIVTFAPTAPGPASGTLSLSYNDGLVTRTVSRPMTGSTASAATLTISDGPTYDFGSQMVGTSTSHVFTVTNQGGVTASDLSAASLAAPFAFEGGSYPGPSGTCGAFLDPAASCTVVVVYAPTAAGSANGTLSLSYNDGLATQTVSRPLTGTALAPAVLSISDAPGFDFGTQAVGSTSEHTFTVTNSGGVSAIGIAPQALSAPFAYKGGSYPGSGGSCGSSLAAGAACSLVVTFSPTATGAASGTLSLGYGNGVSSQLASRALAGTGASPAALSYSGFDFGPRVLGSSTDQVITVSNSGGVTATSLAAASLNAPFSFKGGSYPGAGGSCGGSLAASASCTVVVTFSPTATGNFSALLALSWFNGVSTQLATQSLTGSGVSAAQLTLSDSPTFNFGTQPTGSATDHTFILTNSGGFTAGSLSASGLAAPFSFKGGSYPGTGGSCGSVLAPGASCALVVTFAPTAAGGASASLAIGYDDGGSARTVSVGLAGTGATVAVLALSDAPSFDFGVQVIGGTASHTFTVTNSGGVSASGLSVSGLAGPFALEGGSYPGTGGTCGGSLAAGASCTVVVVFSPSSSGTSTATLSVGYGNGLGTDSTSVGLSGTGLLPAQLSLGAASYDFGAVAVGGSADHLIQVINSGDLAATGLAAATFPAEFTFKGGGYPGTGGTCGTSLAPGAYCVLVVTFAPDAAGAFNGSLVLSYNDGSANHSISQSLLGTGMTGPALAITDWPTNYYANYGVPADGPSFDFGLQGVGGASDHVFSVTNTGTSTATGLGGLLVVAPFNFKGGGYPGTGGSCGASLAPGASCTVIVTFAPTDAVSSSGSVGISYDFGQTVTRDVTGTGTTLAALSLTDYDGVSIGDAFQFGSIGVGGSTHHDFIVRNTGAQTALGVTGLALPAPFSYSGGSFPGSGGTCGAPLAPGASCTVSVSFSPAATGRATGTLSLSYFDGASNQSVSRPLQGSGTNLALLAIQPHNNGGGAFFDYGTHGVGSTYDQGFDVINVGAQTATAIAPRTLPAPFSYRGGSYPGTGGSCGASLAPGASCAIVVTFAPTADGPSWASLALDYNDGASRPTAVEGVTGTGTSRALLSILDNSNGGNQSSPFDFGTSGVPVDHTFFVVNSGGQPATGLGTGSFPALFSFKGGAYPGTGGSCGASLPIGATCTVVVTFSPSQSQVSGGAFTLAYNDGAGPASASRAIVGASTQQALLSVVDCTVCGADSRPADFGTVGSPTDRQFFVQNSGAQVATAMADGGTLGNGFAFKGGSYPGSGGNCGSSLPAGTSCAIVVTFSPSGSGPRSSSITLQFSDGEQSQAVSRAVTGTATNLALVSLVNCPQCGVDSSPIDFGTSGSPVDRSVYVLNSGAQPASAMGDGGTLGNGFSFKGGSYPGAGGTCGSSLPAGASCMLVVTFTPSGSGQRSSTLAVTFFDGSATRSATRAVTGTATNLAVLGISAFFNCPQCGSDPNPYDYGTAGQPVDHTFYVTNTGAQAATGISDVGAFGGGFAFKGGSYPGSGGTCGATLAAGATCSLVVTFTPSGNGPRSSTIALGYNDGASMQLAQRPVQGTATSAAVLQFLDCPQCQPNPNPYDFGTAGQPVDQTFTLYNLGAQPASSMGDDFTLGNGFSFKGGGYPGIGGTCGTSLAPGANCTVVVTFTPSGNGPRSSTLSVLYNDGAQLQLVARGLTGTSTSQAILSVSEFPGCSNCGNNPSPFDYGTAGQPVDHSFYVMNTGAQAATALGDGGTLGNGFAFKGGSYPGAGGTCGTSLAAGASCMVMVTFTPSGNGQRSSTLTLAYFDGAATRSASRGLTGTATTLALVSINDFNGCCNAQGAYDYGTTGIATDHTFYLANTGAQAATSMGDGFTLGSGFSFKGGSYPGSGGTCGTSMAAGASCTVIVTFTPSGTGSSSSTVTVQYFNGSGLMSVSRAVTATSTDRAYVVVRDQFGGADSNGFGPYDFGTVALGGGFVDATFTLINSGAQIANVADGGTLGNPFQYVGGTYPGSGGTCGATLAPGQSCSVRLRFAPTFAGTFASNLSVNLSDSFGALQQVGRALRGTAQ